MISARASRRMALVSLALGLGACGISSPVSRELGARCDGHDECEEHCLSAPEFPGGYCTVSCADLTDCPAGAVCIDLDQGVCLDECTETSDCEFLGTGWQCAERDAKPEGVVKVCVGE